MMNRPVLSTKEQMSNESITEFERRLMLVMGVGGLLFVPVFKTVTHLPPYLGMLFSLSIIWITTEILHRRRAKGMENIDFIWYMKRISLLAMSGYFAGAIVFYLMFEL